MAQNDKSINIKTIFELLAKYNTITNTEMLEILGGIESSKLTEDLGSYYGSILGLLNHQLLADIGWLRALGENILTLDFISPILERFQDQQVPPKELHWTTLEEYRPIRKEIDKLLERVVKTLTLSEYTTSFKIVNRRGTIEYPPFRILLHLFNHHTHHRGGVSVLLDQLNIENSYSNLLWKV